MKECVFCNINPDEYLFENDLAFAVKDKMPASKGHCLVIPKRHARTYFDLTIDEIKAMYELSNKVKTYLDDLYHPDDEGGIMYNDPDINIKWPEVGEIELSEKDKKHPLLKDLDFKFDL